MRHHLRQNSNELTLDFGPFTQTREAPKGSLFQRVRSQMLKRRERTALRRKPLQYQKLQSSLQEKLKKKTFNRDEQRDQLVMLEKCKTYFQMRRNKEHHILTPKATRPEQQVRPHTSSGSVHVAGFLNQLRGVMEECVPQKEIKEDMNLFSFYCRMMDRRLQGIRNTIQKKERMA